VYSRAWDCIMQK